MSINNRSLSERSVTLLSFLFCLWIVSCTIPKNASINVNQENDPNFKIVPNSDIHFEAFNRKIEVFGVQVYAMQGVDESVMLHIANVLAQYLDNNEDGVVDNQAVLDSMVASNASMVIWSKERDLNRLNPPKGVLCQDVGNDETNTRFVPDGLNGPFDAALEEVLHLITNAGYSKVYPDIFGEQNGSAFANAMDVARGGYFEHIPEKYADSAWYSYYDKTCTYDCQIAEYQYWVITSLLGAQKNRGDHIKDEWALNTKELVMEFDSLAFQIVNNPSYQLPKLIPDGSYRH